MLKIFKRKVEFFEEPTEEIQATEEIQELNGVDSSMDVIDFFPDKTRTSGVVYYRKIPEDVMVMIPYYSQATYHRKWQVQYRRSVKHPTAFTPADPTLGGLLRKVTQRNSAGCRACFSEFFQPNLMGKTKTSAHWKVARSHHCHKAEERANYFEVLRQQEVPLDLVDKPETAQYVSAMAETLQLSEPQPIEVVSLKRLVDQQQLILDKLDQLLSKFA